MPTQLHSSRSFCRGSALLLLAVVAVGVLLPRSPSVAYDRITGAPFASRSEVIARHGMAATSQPLATQIALDILKQGGNAVDAAIAANAALGLMEPTGSGIGGDLYAIVWDAKTERLYGLNASGRSPKNLTLQEFKKRKLTSIPSRGPLPVSVPGCVDGWFELHRRFGKLSMDQILQPTIRYAREGFPVSELIAYYWQKSVPVLQEYPGFRATFMPEGRAPMKGEVFKNIALAQTLETIAREGRDAFYKGDIARTIGAFMTRNGGFLRYEDLAAHTSDWVEPVSTSYRGYEVWELPPNTQGIAALQMLNLLEGFDLKQMGFGSADHLHLFVESKKLAFADRARYYADPNFAQVPIAALVSKTYSDERRKLIRLDRAAKVVEPGTPEALKAGDTVYLTVADQDRNMVSLIQSNYRGMGSGLCPDSLGFCLQDRGELFSLEPGHPNVFAPGKRPFHTIIPAFMTQNGKPYLSFGVMGGETQPQGHVWIVSNLIDFGMGLQEAGDAPRILHVGSPEPTGGSMMDGGEVVVETGFATEELRKLQERGHHVGSQVGPYGGFQGILYDAVRDVYIGASESRKDGQAAGY